jgi:pimeloyl-ACP methyl ester carboxylesterase
VADLESIDPENVHRHRPVVPCGTGVLVLAGSSGALPTDRAGFLSDHGADAVALRWFGGSGQHAAPFDIELELFVHVLDELAQTVDRVTILGASFGAEAALSVASRHSTVDAVVAIAPTTHVWPGRSESGTATSHWTWQGSPLPFVPMVDGWAPAEEPPAFRTWYELSLNAAIDPDSARIPVEDFGGDLLLIAGGDDQVWPSADWARDIEHMRSGHDRNTSVISRPDAGHRPTLPGESPPDGGRQMRHGGNAHADSQLGTAAWPRIVATLGLRSEEDSQR